MKFSIYYPVKPLKINQTFGNPDPTYTAMGMLGHNGLDMSAYHGQPIYATHDGTAYYEIDGSSGHGVVLKTTSQFDYNGTQAYMKTIYWHMCDSSKEPQFKSPVEGHDGIFIRSGDLLGYADNTGVSTGDHLHFGLKPMGVGELDGAWFNIEQNNGYLGAIDPTPYFNGKFAVEIFHPLMPCEYGDDDSNVASVQSRLMQLGYTIPAGATGYYGDQTKSAVYKFQLDHVSLSIYEKLILRGSKVGPKTLAALSN